MSLLKQYNPATVQKASVYPIWYPTAPPDTVPGSNPVTLPGVASDYHSAIGFLTSPEPICGQMFRVDLMLQRLQKQVLGNQPVTPGEFIFIFPITIEKPYRYIVVCDSSFVGCFYTMFVLNLNVMGIGPTSYERKWFMTLYNSSRVQFNKESNLCQDTVSAFINDTALVNHPDVTIPIIVPVDYAHHILIASTLNNTWGIEPRME